MTARRNDNGDFEIIKWDGKTITYRGLIFLGVMSLTPFGDWAFARFGIVRPAQEAAQEVAVKMDNRMAALETKIARMSGDIDELTTQVAKVKKRNELETIK